MLNFQSLDVYRCAIEFLALTTGMVEGLPRGHSALADQLRRAAMSIPLNIAEGQGRVTEADKARTYAIARGSAMECVAVIDVLRTLAILDEERHRKAEELLERVVSMSTKMCR